MKCHECGEQIEVGEACRTEYLVGTHMQYFHVGCHLTWFEGHMRSISEAESYFEELALQARSVC